MTATRDRLDAARVPRRRSPRRSRRLRRRPSLHLAAERHHEHRDPADRSRDDARARRSRPTTRSASCSCRRRRGPTISVARPGDSPTTRSSIKTPSRPSARCVPARWRSRPRRSTRTSAGSRPSTSITSTRVSTRRRSSSSSVGEGNVTMIETAADLQYERKRLRIDGAGGIAVPIGVGAAVWPEAKLVVRYASMRRSSSCSPAGARAACRRCASASIR